MTAPSDPKDAVETLEEPQEIILRLGDILPRVPAHLLKPGPHDTTPEIRFSVEELAEKISRGRVSVPLKRLSSVCPTVFRDCSAFPGEQEVPLPLQKLLEQVGLVVPKSATDNGIPGDQLSQARAEAARIIESNSNFAPQIEPPPDPEPVETPVPSSNLSTPISKAISTARHLLGLLGLQTDSPPTAEKAADVTPPESEQPPSPSTSNTPTETPPVVQSAPPPPAPPPVPPTPATPEGCISVRLLPILRLLSPPVLKSGNLPSDDARVALPLSAIDPQLPGGHVEIPVEDFFKGLSEDLRYLIDPLPGNQIWIPLDEIFQNLPTNHLFYMPPFDPFVHPNPTEPAEDIPTSEPAPELKEEPAPAAAENEKAPEPVQEIADKTEPPTPPPATPEPPQPQEPTPAVESASPPEPPESTAPPEPIPAPPAPPTQSPPEPPPSRAPWMRGFQVPPPRLFSSAAPPTETPAAASPTEPPTPSSSTPEAKRTADFLAAQTGIFAAAAFVEGAVFASTDFPRKPDLEALREFMGSFIDHARDSARRLGWNRVVTLPCEQFYLTAVVRDTHFIVALHHDRVLASDTYDALIAAADDLGKATGGSA